MAENQKHAINWRLIWKIIKAIFSLIFVEVYAVFTYTIFFILLWLIVFFAVGMYFLIHGSANYRIWLAICEETYILSVLYVILMPYRWLDYFNKHIKEKKKGPRR